VYEVFNLLTATVDSQKYSLHNPQNLSKSEARLELANIFRRFLPHLSVNSEDMYRLYVSHLPETDYPAIRRAIGRAIGDYLSTCPTLLFANGVSGQGDVNTTRVFQYVWSVKYDSQGWHGSDHGLDIGFIFGAPFRDTYISNASDSQLLNERRVSLSAMETVANFARYGCVWAGSVLYIFIIWNIQAHCRFLKKKVNTIIRKLISILKYGLPKNSFKFLNNNTK